MRHLFHYAIPALTLTLTLTGCLLEDGVGDIADELRAGSDRPALIECRDDRACPRGSYCEEGLGICFTSSRCYVNGRPSDEFCERTYGDGFICLEYAPDSHHCVPTAAPPPPPEPAPIRCRDDSPCPRGSYCEEGLGACFTSSRCYVNGRPSDEFCERAYGEDFACYEYAPGSHHCMPLSP